MTPQEKAFEGYKKAEDKALAILSQMRQSGAKKVDIELALMTAIFDLHKGTLPPATVGKIIQGHLETLVPFFESSQKPPSGN